MKTTGRNTGCMEMTAENIWRFAGDVRFLMKFDNGFISLVFYQAHYPITGKHITLIDGNRREQSEP